MFSRVAIAMATAALVCGVVTPVQAGDDVTDCRHKVGVSDNTGGTGGRTIDILEHCPGSTRPVMTYAEWMQIVSARCEAQAPAAEGAVSGAVHLGSVTWCLAVALAPKGKGASGSLAQEVADQMQIEPPQIGMTGGGQMQLVGWPVWLWVQDPDTYTHAVTKSVDAGGVPLSATARFDKTVWDMGDGNQVECTQTTEYSSRYGGDPSPTCGYTYSEQSNKQPDDVYTITVTAYWTVTWSGGGEFGTIPLDVSQSAQVKVGEMQVLRNVEPDKS